MKLDILAFAAHPDDTELACSGTLLKHLRQGKKVGVVDLTTGQLGSRGTPEIRIKEAESAASILGLTIRDNLNMEDGFFKNDGPHRERLIRQIRQYQPDIVLANAITDRHPDHGRAATLVADACFFSGLEKIETQFNGVKQNHWRPRAVYHYIQDRYMKPDFIVDISDEFDLKVKSILAFKSQFYNPESKEPETLISSKQFLDFIEARAREFGRVINTEFGEGFIGDRTIGVDSLFSFR